MKSFEEMVQSVIQEKLNSEVIEEVIENKLQAAVSEACDSLFKWSGDGKKLIEDKLKDMLIPALERSNFTKYSEKLDIALSEIIRNTSLVDNKKILESFSSLMKEPEMDKIELSKLFEEYTKYVAKKVDTCGLEPLCEDGEPYYESVSVEMNFSEDEKSWFKSSFTYATVRFSCEHDSDNELTFDLTLSKYDPSGKWRPLFGRGMVDFNALAHISDFELLILKLNRANVEIIVDTEFECDEVTPEETPDWSLN